MSRKPLLWITLTLSIISISVISIALTSIRPSEAILSMPDLLKRVNEETPSQEYLKAEEQVQKYRADLKEHPDKIEDYVRLAEVYLQESRVTANHHFYVPIAASLLSETLRRDPNNFEALVVSSGLAMTLHQFSKAHDMVVRAIAQNPYNSTAYGVLCDANVELGNYPQAIVACDSMMSKRPDLRSYARASYLRQLTGHDNAAIQAMLLAADAGVAGSEARSWSLYQLGNLFFQNSKLDTAAFIFRGILEERPGYAYAHSGLAMIHLARSEYSDAVRELVTAIQQLPEHLFLEQLADAYLAMADTSNARTMENKVFAAFEQHESDGWNIDREYALFALDHGVRLSEALERAEREWRHRPNNADAIETYAWALFKNGRVAESIGQLDRLRQTGITTPTCHYRAAMIYAAQGNTASANQQLSLARTRMPYTRPVLLRDANNALASRSLFSLK